jgi:hypothetical protein
MKLDRRTRIAALLVLLALVAGLPGPLVPCVRTMPCCHSGMAPVVKARTCCELKTLASPEASRAVAPPSPVVVALAAPALPGEPLVAAPVPPLPVVPPLVHEGIPLYTLNSVFLI